MTFIRNFRNGKIVYRDDFTPRVFQFLNSNNQVVAEAESEIALEKIVKRILSKNFKRDKVYLFNQYGHKIIEEGEVTSCVGSRVRVRVGKSTGTHDIPTKYVLLHTPENFDIMQKVVACRKQIEQIDKQIDGLVRKLAAYTPPKEEADGEAT